MPSMNPKDTTITIDGVPVTGWAAEDEPCTWDYVADRLVDDESGTDGDSAFAEINDRRADLIIRLLSTAAYNNVLAVLAEAGAEFVVGAEDANGESVGASPAGRIAKRPPLRKRRKIGTNEWIIRTHDTRLKVGGLTGVADVSA